MENQSSLIIKKTCPVHPEQTRNALDSLIDCTFCIADRSKMQQDLNNDRAQDQVKRRLKNLGNGKRFGETEFATYVPRCEKEKLVFRTCKRYVETFKDRLKSGDNLLFLGTEGTGKTHLAVSIAKELIRAGHSARYTSLFKMIGNIKRTWGKGKSEADENQIMEMYTSPDILIIDEVGVQMNTNVEQVYLMNIINSRYEEMLPTIMITNLDEENLVDVIGAQVLDRFYEGKSSILSCAWPSYRRKDESA